MNSCLSLSRLCFTEVSIVSCSNIGRSYEMTMDEDILPSVNLDSDAV
jgi:hypothetical protein